MEIVSDFTDALPRYRRLYLLWLLAIGLLLLAQFVMPWSTGLALALFVAGAVDLGAAGVACAYSLAKQDSFR